MKNYKKIYFVVDSKDLIKVGQEFLILIILLLALNLFLNYFIHHPKISEKLKTELEGFKIFLNNFILIIILGYHFFDLIMGFINPIIKSKNLINWIYIF